MSWKLISEISSDVKGRNTTAEEMVKEAFKAIEEKKDFQAIISLTKERAEQRAREIDQAIKEDKKVGRLAGVPFIAKDNFLAFGSETTAASNILKGFNAPYQATAIEKLEAEGAICVAKANLDAFAHGSSTENSDWFVTKNPVDPTRVPGGSSGGSAVAVALQMVPFALGTDTGGSIRLPASFCGIVGFKPTYGLISRSGVIAMASSTDVIGPLTRNVDDAALVMDILAGKDPLDSTTIERDKLSYTDLDEGLVGKKIGLVKEFFGNGLDKNVEEKINQVVSKLEKAGAEVTEVSIPSINLALAIYYIICPAEVSSNLARYDGQRFGFSDPEANTLDEVYELSRGNGFGAEAKRRIMIGTYVLSSGYYDAYYKKAQIVRTKLINEFNLALSKVDFLLGPTAPETAFKIGQNTDDPLKMYLTDIMTVAANIVGVPAISIPAGEVDNLPVGVQFMSAQRKDRQLLSLAKAYEVLL